MKFNIPKIIRPLEMSVYAEEMKGLAFQVWVNPNRGVHNAYWDLQADLKKLSDELDELLKPKKPDAKKIAELNERIDVVNEAVFAWFANIWSQSSDASTHVAVEELKDMTSEDPALWTFLTQGTTAMMRDHREGIRKN